MEAEAELYALQAGNYSLSVFLGTGAANNLVGSSLNPRPFPAKLTVFPGPTNVNTTRVSMFSQSLTAGSSLNVTVIPADAFGNHQQYGLWYLGDVVSGAASLLGQPPIFLDAVLDVSSNNYLVSDVLIISGLYSLQVQLFQ